MTRSSRDALSNGHPKSRRVVRRLMIALALLVAGYVTFSLAVIQFPTTDSPTSADAIIVLGQPDQYSLAQAVQLLADGNSAHLVLSTPHGEPSICDHAPPGVTVECFEPDPSTTRGEAQEIARLAAARGWTNIMVVTWPTHISRARMLIERCYSGRLQMVDYDDHLAFGDRIAENLYQTGAFVKVFANRGC